MTKKFKTFFMISLLSSLFTPAFANEFSTNMQTPNDYVKGVERVYKQIKQAYERRQDEYPQEYFAPFPPLRMVPIKYTPTPIGSMSLGGVCSIVLNQNKQSSWDDLFALDPSVDKNLWFKFSVLHEWGHCQLDLEKGKIYALAPKEYTDNQKKLWVSEFSADLWALSQLTSSEQSKMLYVLEKLRHPSNNPGAIYTYAFHLKHAFKQGLLTNTKGDTFDSAYLDTFKTKRQEKMQAMQAIPLVDQISAMSKNTTPPKLGSDSENLAGSLPVLNSDMGLINQKDIPPLFLAD